MRIMLSLPVLVLALVIATVLPWQSAQATHTMSSLADTSASPNVGAALSQHNFSPQKASGATAFGALHQSVQTTPTPAPTSTPPTPTPEIPSCPGAPQSRLVVGELARVTFTNGIPLRVRAAPAGAQTAQLGEGTAVIVVGGPQCQGQYAWWQIQMDNGQLGWAAEGDWQDYYLEPIGPAPDLPVMKTPMFNCTGAPHSRLFHGDQARVAYINGMPLRMYWSANGEFKSTIEEGTVVTLTQGPTCTGEHVWWKISAEGAEGWVMEADWDYYYLEPWLGCPGAPPPRLAVGWIARVTISNGKPLRVRSEVGGAYVAQLSEGSIVHIIDGPQCRRSYVWWRVQSRTGVLGWVAEGDHIDYYIEPWQNASVQGNLVVPQGDCSKAPSISLAEGMTIATSPLPGTYGFRFHLTDAVVYRVQPNTPGLIVGGPMCQDGYRYWQVQMMLDGQQMTGWLSEGTQQQYYLIPFNPS